MTAYKDPLEPCHDKFMQLTSTYFSKQSLGLAPMLDNCSLDYRTHEQKGAAYEGRMVPLAPPSGISLFFNDCVEARP